MQIVSRARASLSPDLVSGPEDGGELRSPVIGVFVGIFLLFQEDTLLLQSLNDGCCALFQHCKTCMHAHAVMQWSCAGSVAHTRGTQGRKVCQQCRRDRMQSASPWNCPASSVNTPALSTGAMIGRLLRRPTCRRYRHSEIAMLMDS